MPHGGSGQTITVSTDNAPVMRLDIDADRAAVQWPPDDSYAIEMDTGTERRPRVPDDRPRDIPAALARATGSTARRVLTDYVATGMRPTSVNWHVAI